MSVSGLRSPGQSAEAACLLEVLSPKAGNVHRGRDFEDLHFVDFQRSATAIRPVFERAPTVPVGETVIAAIRATRAVVSTNTNLGVVLLLAPLARVFHESEYREALAESIAETTIGDSELVYQAIRLAKPGGLGKVKTEDVHEAPTRPLVEVMKLAADHDLIARQYATNFTDVFDRGLPALREALERGLSTETSVVFAQLKLLADLGDTLIQRKCDAETSRAAARGAGNVIASGWPEHPEGLKAFQELDSWLLDEGHRRNPGATADLVAASLFVALREGLVAPPEETGA